MNSDTIGGGRGGGQDVRIHTVRPDRKIKGGGEVDTWQTKPNAGIT